MGTRRTPCATQSSVDSVTPAQNSIETNVTPFMLGHPTHLYISYHPALLDCSHGDLKMGVTDKAMCSSSSRHPSESFGLNEPETANTNDKL